MTKCPNLGGLKEQKYTLSQFWGPDIQDPLVGMLATLPLSIWVQSHDKLVAATMLGAGWLTTTSFQSLPVLSHGDQSACPSVSLSFYEDISHSV